MHAALAYGAPALLHRPERELPQAAQDTAADRPERAERLHRHGIGVERSLRIERFTVLIGRTRTPFAGAKADGGSEIPIRLQRLCRNFRRARVLRVRVKDHLQRTADCLTTAEVSRCFLE